MKRESGFDILRVFAMVYIVFFYHIDDYAGDIFTNSLTSLFVKIALSVFFFISAFLLTGKYQILTTKTEVINFIKSRIYRIYPMYIIALILYFLVGLIQLDAFLSGLFLMNIFLDIYVKTLWFISVLMIFYFLFIIVIFKYSFLKLLFVYIITNILLFIGYKYGFVSESLFIYMPSFFFGVVFNKYKFLRNNSTNIKILFLLFIIPVLYFFSAITIVPLTYIVIIISIPFIYFASQLLNINSKIITKISYASFVMYMSHRLIYELLLYIYYPTSNILVIMYLLVIGAPMTYFISMYIQQFYDKYFYINLKKVDK